MTRPPGYFDREVRLHTEAQMFQKLSERTGKPVDQIRNQANQAPSDAGTYAPTPRGSLSNSLGTECGAPHGEAGNRASPQVSPLSWFAPVKNPDGTGFVRCQNAPYVVSKAFVEGQPQYSAFHEKTSLGASESLQGGKDIATQHWHTLRTAKPSETT